MNYLNLSHLLVPETESPFKRDSVFYKPSQRINRLDEEPCKVVQMSERTLRNECEDMKALDLIEVPRCGDETHRSW